MAAVLNQIPNTISWLLAGVSGDALATEGKPGHGQAFGAHVGLISVAVQGAKDYFSPSAVVGQFSAVVTSALYAHRRLTQYDADKSTAQLVRGVVAVGVGAASTFGDAETVNTARNATVLGMGSWEYGKSARITFQQRKFVTAFKFGAASFVFGVGACFQGWKLFTPEKSDSAT